MTTVIEIEQPVDVVFERWTRLDEFPRFMDGVEDVVPLDDGHCRWTIFKNGHRWEWVAELIDRVPDRHLSFRATDGTHNSCEVSFRPLSEGRTLVSLDIDTDPEWSGAETADWVDVPSAQARADLRAFKDYVEHGHASPLTGPSSPPAWIAPWFGQ